MKRKKWLWFLLVVLVLIQFIRPAKNNGEAQGANDITQVISTSDEVKQILQISCYDCHSNHTDYLWYFNIQPVNAWLSHHINEGKEELNFSEFKTYKLKRQAHKLKEIAEQVKSGEMPLPSYIWIHKEAKLTQAQADLLYNWASHAQDSLQKAGGITP